MGNHIHRIGIIGGMGQHAGFDLAKKIADNTLVMRDQDHLPIVIASLPNRIPSRTAYLQSSMATDDPKPGIQQALDLLLSADARLVGMACNTAHAPGIVDPVLESADRAEIEFVSIISATANSISGRFGSGLRVGIMATSATIEIGLYQEELDKLGIEYVVPSTDLQERITEGAIKNKDWGLKAIASPPDPRAVEICHDAVQHLVDRGADAVILGCTELPLAIREHTLLGATIIDPTVELARELIRRYDSSRLKPVTHTASATHP